MLNPIQAKYERDFIRAGGNVGLTPNQLRRRAFPDNPTAAYDNADPSFYYKRDQRDRERYDKRALTGLAHTIIALTDGERRTLKGMLADYDRANGLAQDQSTEPNSGTPPYEVDHVANRDQNHRREKLLKLAHVLHGLPHEEIAHVCALLDGMKGIKRTEPASLVEHLKDLPEEEEQEPEYDEGEGVGPEDLPGGMKPIPGGGMTSRRNNTLAQDAEDMAFDEAFPEVARIGISPSYGAPVRKRREPSMSIEDERRFNAMFPEVARLGR
jgi:hypothetical protein